MNTSRFCLILGLILTGLFSRLLPHPPNFTSLNAIALFGAFYFESRWLAFAVVSGVMFLSDAVIGFYPTISFIYLSFGLITLLGSRLKEDNSLPLTRVAAVSLTSSLLFFFVTNFGDWLMLSLYPKTLEGLTACYLAGIPFLAPQVFGDLVYTVLFFKIYELAKPYKKTFFLSE